MPIFYDSLISTASFSLSSSFFFSLFSPISFNCFYGIFKDAIKLLAAQILS